MGPTDSTDLHLAPGTAGVRRAGSDDLGGLSETLAAAFFDDPMVRWWIPEPAPRAAILPPVFRLITGSHAAYDGLFTTDDFSAGAVWVPPGRGATEAEASEAWPRYANVIGEYADRLLTFFGLTAERHPTEPHWYLYLLATRPERQGQGLGSRLLRTVLTDCDRDGMPAYLESTSEDSRRLYLRHGFEVTGEIHLPAGPTMWCMWREPRQSA